jgi:hypothetical protein
MRQNNEPTIPTRDIKIIEPMTKGGNHGRQEVSKKSGKKGCEEGRGL